MLKPAMHVVNIISHRRAYAPITVALDDPPITKSCSGCLSSV